MVESFGMQQVLQLSNVVERAQFAQQHQADEVSRAFDRELEKLAEREGDQTRETKETEETRPISDEDQRRRRRQMRLLLKPGEEEKEEKEEGKPAVDESGHGQLINVVI